MHKVYTYEEIKNDSKKFEEVFLFIKKFGSHTMAYSILQPKMYYFISDLGLVAYAKYKTKRKRCYILADPLCYEKNLKELLESFLKINPKSTFVQVSEKTAKILNNLKYFATPMGIETTIKLEKFDINGERKKKLRNNIRNCKKELTILEDNELSEININELKKISENWLKEKKKTKKEINFLTRPFVTDKEIDVRKFYAIKDNKIVGFMVFNPVYFEEKLIGYTADITRILDNAPRGSGDYILYLALKKFKREGHPLLSLGLSPFADLHKDKLGLHNKSTLRLLKYIYNKGEKLYHFQGLDSHKKQFEGKEHHVYFSHKKRFPIYQIYQLFKICNVI